MLEYIYVMTAGAIGATCRYGTDKLFKYYLGTQFPYGTLCVNILGCLLFGMFMQWDTQTAGVSKALKLLVTSGFLGAFTTFSTFGYDTFAFIKAGSFLPAALNISLNIVAGLLAVWLGTIVIKGFAS